MALIGIDELGLESIVVVDSDTESVVVDISVDTLVVDAEVTTVISEGIAGPPGKGLKGDPGDAASLSTDPENRSRLGDDGKIYTPELTTDPLAFYILAKS